MLNNLRLSLIIVMLSGLPSIYTQAQRNTQAILTPALGDVSAQIGPQGPEPGGGGHGFTNISR